MVFASEFNLLFVEFRQYGHVFIIKACASRWLPRVPATPKLGSCLSYTVFRRDDENVKILQEIKRKPT